MQLFPLRLLPVNPNFDFIKTKKISYTFSLLILLGSSLLIGLNKFNFGIDFTGGISIEVRINTKPDITKIREILNTLNIGEVVIQSFDMSNDLLIKVGTLNQQKSIENIALIKQTLSNHYPEYIFDYRKIDFVGPQVGEQIITSGIISMILSFFAIMVYIWIRFEWHFGLGILVALIHDVILSLGFMSITKYDFNLSTIAAILTVIGYSVNDSVVIYDRIRENLRIHNKKEVNKIINISINETLSRTTITVFTTLLANLSLIILGGKAIHSFSIMVFMGILIGTYSSIFISAPILNLFNLKKT